MKTFPFFKRVAGRATGGLWPSLGCVVNLGFVVGDMRFGVLLRRVIQTDMCSSSPGFGQCF